MVQTSKLPPEMTDLERRVLAHERVLQTLIAYMSRTEPRFVEHLEDKFVAPLKMVPHEHDYRDSDDYAAEFIRAVMLLGEASVPRDSASTQAVDHPQPIADKRLQDFSSGSPVRRERVQIRQINGIWEVKVDNVFHGDYHQKEQAMTAAALLKLSLR